MYLTSLDNKARFVLGNPGKRNLAVFGVNPSTATDVQADPTIRRIQGYSQCHGYDGWIVFNLYPQRTTNPDNLHTEADLDLCSRNIAEITKVLELLEEFSLCAAWGGLIERRKYLASCLTDISATIDSQPWFSIGEPTKHGHPRHPLYVKTKSPLQLFDLPAYLEKL